MSDISIPYIVCSILAFVPAIVLHEVSHGWVAYKLGDPTAKRSGRLSLNPAKHVDIFGTIILPAMLMLAGARFSATRSRCPTTPCTSRTSARVTFWWGLPALRRTW